MRTLLYVAVIVRAGCRASNSPVPCRREQDPMRATRRVPTCHPLQNGLAAFLALAAVVTCPVACQHKTESPSRRYHLKGTVVAVSLNNALLVVSHEAIPGFMGAMTMGYAVRDRRALAGLSPGDEITADVVVQGNDSWLENIVVVEKTASPPQALAPVRPPEPGEVVPDFSFVNQYGREEHFSKFRGNAVLLTFIYARCPLPDYCPRMNLNFAEINLALSRRKQLYSATHLLSVSFDPKHDTPSVLKRYGEDFTAKTDPSFRHWEFVAVPQRELRQVAQFFGLSYWQDGAQIVHSMSTTLVAPDGRVDRWYGGNGWQPIDVLRDLDSLFQPGRTQD